MHHRIWVGYGPVLVLGALLRKEPIEEGLRLVLGVVGTDANVVDTYPFHQVFDSVHVVRQRRLKPLPEKWGKSINQFTGVLTVIVIIIVGFGAYSVFSLDDLKGDVNDVLDRADKRVENFEKAISTQQTAIIKEFDEQVRARQEQTVELFSVFISDQINAFVTEQTERASGTIIQRLQEETIKQLAFSSDIEALRVALENRVKQNEIDIDGLTGRR